MPSGREEVSGLQETDGVESTTPETTGSSDETRNESTRETVARALKELSSQESDGDQSGEGESIKINPTKESAGLLGDPTNTEGQQAQKTKAAKPDKSQQTPDPDLEPPNRFQAPSKELFNKLPAGLKKELNRTIKDLEAQATRSNQEYSKATNEVRGYLEAVQPYIQDWGRMGFSGPGGVAALAATQAKLLNPQTREQTFLELASDLQLSHLIGKGDGAAPNGAEAASDISNHPTVKALQNENNALRQKVDLVFNNFQQTQQTQFDAGAQGIATEMMAVRDEQDQAGRYRHPELHDEAFLESTKPLVSALIGTVPGISYGDALRRSWSMLTGKPLTTSTQPNQARLPAAGNTNSRAASAAVTVRGRGASIVNGQAEDEIPQDVLNQPGSKATVAYSLEMLRRRRAAGG